MCPYIVAHTDYFRVSCLHHLVSTFFMRESDDVYTTCVVNCMLLNITILSGINNVYVTILQHNKGSYVIVFILYELFEVWSKHVYSYMS